MFSVTLRGLDKVTLGREKLKQEVFRFSSVDFAPLIPLVNDFQLPLKISRFELLWILHTCIYFYIKYLY